MVKGKETKVEEKPIPDRLSEVERLKIRIQKAESEKDDIRLLINVHTTYFITILVFIGTIGITVTNGLPTIKSKTISLISWLILLGGIVYIFSKKYKKDVKQKIDLKEKEIERLYANLLNEPTQVNNATTPNLNIKTESKIFQFFRKHNWILDTATKLYIGIAGGFTVAVYKDKLISADMIVYYAIFFILSGMAFGYLTYKTKDENKNKVN